MSAAAAVFFREMVREAVERQRPGMDIGFVPDEPTLRFALFCRACGSGSDEFVYYTFKPDPHTPIDELSREADDGVREWLRVYDENKEKIA